MFVSKQMKFLTMVRLNISIYLETAREATYHLYSTKLRLSFSSIVISWWWSLLMALRMKQVAVALQQYWLQKLPTQTGSFITFTTCKSLILKQVVAAWQQRWDRSAIGRITHETIPIVSKRIMFPKKRCTAISYIRLAADEWLDSEGSPTSHGTCRCKSVRM